MDEIITTIVENIPRTLDDLADTIHKVPMSPYFLCVHYYLIALTLRNRTGAKSYASEHPFPSWFVCVVSCFGGSLISNFLMNLPLLDIFMKNTTNILYITLIWYSVMFSPFDVIFKFCRIRLVKSILLASKEVHRIRQILDGVLKVAAMYPNSTNSKILFVAVMIGSIRGSGAKFLLRPLDSFIRGTIMADNEFLKPTFSTKHSMVSSILIMLQRMKVIDLELPMLLLLLVAVAVVVQLAILLGNMQDPYTALENMLTRILLALSEDEYTGDPEKQKKE